MKIAIYTHTGNLLGTLQDTPTGLRYGGPDPNEVMRLARDLSAPERPEEHPHGTAGFVRWMWRKLPGNGYAPVAIMVTDTWQPGQPLPYLIPPSPFPRAAIS